MFDVTFIIVPPGGGEADYQLPMSLPAVPQKGDYITVIRENASGSEDFIVRRAWWNLAYPDGPNTSIEGEQARGSLNELFVEVEFAIGFLSSDDHKRAAGPDANSFEASAY